ncbi:MAG: response regulator [Actinobacteria bacterium]|nr:response regulator [Actinomycetota bacterium]
MANAGLALFDLAPDSPARRALAQIELGARRAGELADQLLTYSGKARTDVRPVNMSTLVEEMAELIRAGVSKNADLRCELDPHVPAVAADATQLRQVVLNLITNAAEALGEERGSGTVRTGVAEPDPVHRTPVIPSGEGPTGPCAFVEVADSGPGIDAAIQQRMFEQFFTTKFAWRGLGLAVVLGIVRGHSGALEVESTLGKGSRFRVLLPPAPFPVAVAPAPNAPAATAPLPGGATVLLVDDEPSVRDVSAQVLQRLGLTVLSAADGVEAQRLFRQYADTIDVVLLDMTMPGLDGDSVLRRLRAIRPRARVVLMSGFSKQDAAARVDAGDLAGFLHKPFGVQELREAVGNALLRPS